MCRPYDYVFAILFMTSLCSNPFIIFFKWQISFISAEVFNHPICTGLWDRHSQGSINGKF